MTVFQSMGALEAVATGGAQFAGASQRSGGILYDSLFRDYATLWRTQPNIRLCTEFLARNMAQLSIDVLDRASDTDRLLLHDHELSQALRRPNPYMTRYRLIEHLMMSLGIYHEGFWLKVRPPGARLLLVPISPRMVTNKYGGLWPTGYRVQFQGRIWDVPAADMAHFHCHNPESELGGISPMETLRQILASEQAAIEYQEGYWRNGARIGQVVERPVEAPEWSDDALERFRSDLTEFFTSRKGTGGVAVLEEGMKLVKGAFSPDESEYIPGRKLAREECARAYHIPPPMVGILENATLANVKEYHSHLYQDTLGPWCVMIAEDIRLQILPEFDPDPDTSVYVEFDIASKLKGTPEDQMSALAAAAGAPILLRDEARARLNLNALPDGQGESIITPLNVLEGSTPLVPPDAIPAAPAKARIGAATSGVTIPAEDQKAATLTALKARFRRIYRHAVRGHFDRQGHAILELVERKAPASVAEIRDVLDDPRWADQLRQDFVVINWATAKTFGGRLAASAGLEFEPERMRAWLDRNADAASGAVVGAGRSDVLDALTTGIDAEAIRRVYGSLADSRADRVAQTQTTAISGFGEHDAARQGGLAAKTWVVTSPRPRESHAAISGLTVGIDDVFSNGLRFPGDPSGGPDETAGCTCRLTYSAGGA